nr:immunoglobulin heavy chain junction region [Mus musculus]
CARVEYDYDEGFAYW